MTSTTNRTRSEAQLDRHEKYRRTRLSYIDLVKQLDPPDTEWGLGLPGNWVEDRREAINESFALRRNEDGTYTFGGVVLTHEQAAAVAQTVCADLWFEGWKASRTKTSQDWKEHLASVLELGGLK